MDILGIGMPEIIFILIIAMIVFGPKDLEKTGKTVGRWIFRFIKSDTYRNFRELGTLPNKLIREAGLEEAQEKGELTPGTLPKGQNVQTTTTVQSETSPAVKADGAAPENKIQPPSVSSEAVVKDA